MNLNKHKILKLTFFLLAMAGNPVFAEKYMFYLHGAIVESQGAKAVSPSFGEYKYDDILAAFRKEGFTVMSEVRKPNTDIKEYARTITEQINGLLKKGIPAKDITVVGASKGALIAMHVSDFVKNKEMNFVFLAACNDGNFESFPEIRYYGNILSIYERSDGIGESCYRFREKSAATVSHYKEIEISTGLEHGFLFRPLPEWMKPTVAWANGDYK
ncbi:MAG TPA: alpha/beta hydrolase [Chitinophagales bacterium]|nr:alpha/beta hydrolase [Chitinophagales bacterium]